MKYGIASFLTLLRAKSQSIMWKSHMWDLPSSILKFSLKARINKLPTFNKLLTIIWEGRDCFSQLPLLWKHLKTDQVQYLYLLLSHNESKKDNLEAWFHVVTHFGISEVFPHRLKYITGVLWLWWTTGLRWRV